MKCRLALQAISFGLLATLTGCHLGGNGNLTARPEPTLPKVSLTAKEAIERHNENASLVKAVEARTSINMKSSTAGGAKVSGRLAMERPRNFALKLSHSAAGTVADIGSNSDEFWFWTKKGRSGGENEVLVCNYDDVDRSVLPPSFQPDWIVEAMGLRPITREEAAKIESKPGENGTIKLVSTRRGNNGENLIKETVIAPSGEIREHRLLQEDRSGRRPKLLAHATVSQTQTVAINDSGEKVVLPQQMRLEWIEEQLQLDIYIDRLTVNKPISEEDRQIRFSEPEIAGAKRVNLAQYAAGPAAAPSGRASRAIGEGEPVRPRSSTRSSRSAPAPGDVRLGAPEPVGTEGAYRSRDNDPVALTADLSAANNESAIERVVRPGFPTPNEP